MPLMTSQCPTFLLPAVLFCALAAQGNPARAWEDMVCDTDEIEVSTEPSSDEMPDSDDELHTSSLSFGSAPRLW